MVKLIADRSPGRAGKQSGWLPEGLVVLSRALLVSCWMVGRLVGLVSSPVELVVVSRAGIVS